MFYPGGTGYRESPLWHVFNLVFNRICRLGWDSVCAIYNHWFFPKPDPNCRKNGFLYMSVHASTKCPMTRYVPGTEDLIDKQLRVLLKRSTSTPVACFVISISRHSYKMVVFRHSRCPAYEPFEYLQQPRVAYCPLLQLCHQPLLHYIHKPRQMATRCTLDANCSCDYNLHLRHIIGLHPLRGTQKSIS